MVHSHGPPFVVPFDSIDARCLGTVVIVHPSEMAEVPLEFGIHILAPWKIESRPSLTGHWNGSKCTSETYLYVLSRHNVLGAIILRDHRCGELLLTVRTKFMV
jgi:hypothetical protein